MYVNYARLYPRRSKEWERLFPDCYWFVRNADEWHNKGLPFNYVTPMLFLRLAGLMDEPLPKPKEKNPIDWGAARRAADLKPVAMTRLEDGQPAAVIRNLSTIKKGDIVSTTYKGRMYRWRVVGVSQGGIQTEELEVSQ